MIVLLLAALVAGLMPGPGARGVERVVLTSDGPAYHYRLDGERLAVRAGRSTQEPNRREIVLDPGAGAARDQTSCATWARQGSWRIQPGLAVRVVDRAGRVRAVTLTKNIVFGMQTVMNLVTWDTARRGDPWRAVGQYDLAPTLLRRDGRLRPLPWRACLRVDDRRVSFKVWPLGRADRPSWSDRAGVRHARLPRAWDYAGTPGWYAGHLPARGRLVYRGLLTR